MGRPGMTQPAQAQITGNAPAQDQTLESILSEELKSLHAEVESLVKGGLSEEEAQGLLDWAAELEGKIKAVAAVLANPSPETVSKYLRYVAARVSATRSRTFAASSLRLLRSVLARVSGSYYTHDDLKKKSLAELDRLAKGMGLKDYNRMDRKGMSEAILRRVEMSKSPEERSRS